MAAAAGCHATADAKVLCAAYVRLLARWNRTINLTALPLDPPTDAAIARLIVEPLAAAPLVRPTDRAAIDLGSGGGSPALPLKIACPALQMTLVESRSRKCAFLREAVRHLELPEVDVVNASFAEFAAAPMRRGSADLITARALRADAEFWRVVDVLLRPEGQVLWFGSARVESAGFTIVGAGSTGAVVVRRA